MFTASIIMYLLRVISLISGVYGLWNTGGIAAGEYGATPFSLTAISGAFITSAATFVGSFLAKPINWETIRKWLESAISYMLPQLKAVDLNGDGIPDDTSRAVSGIADLAIMLLAHIIANRWPATKGEALKALATIRYCKLVQEGGAPPTDAIARLAPPPVNPPSAAK